MNALRPILLAVSVWWASALAGPAHAVETTEDSGLQFAIALVQDLSTFAEPGVVRAGTSAAFEMPILTPHQVVGRRCVGGAGVACEGGVEWVQVKRQDGRASGWVEANLVEIWNSRHALKPNNLATAGEIVPGYCGRAAVQDYLEGEASPCMQFTPALLARQSDRAPFPVVGVMEGEIGGIRRTFLEVLVPTTYSNIAPLKGGTTARPVVGEGTMEVVILIDATGSMAEAIRETASALAQTVDGINRARGTKAKFLVLAYRDTDGANRGCPAMEGTVADGALGFVTASEARSFLGGVKACQGGDGPEAIWDALYLLRDVPVEPGARRIVILAGDAPATDVARGAGFAGVTPRPGMSREEIFKQVSATIGRSTEFVGFMVDADLEGTVDAMTRNLAFRRTSVVSFASGAANMESEILEKVLKEVAATTRAKAAIDNCRRTLASDHEGRSVPLFCGDAADDEIARRIADIAVQEDDLVLRRLFVQTDSNLDDVALLSQREASRTARAMADLAASAAAKGCAAMGADAWVETIQTILPGKDTSSGGSRLLSQPPVDASLHRYWGLHVRSGETILNLRPALLEQLDGADCRDLTDRLQQASQAILRLQSEYAATSYLWLPFDQIP